MLLSDLSQQKLLSHTGRCFDVRYSSNSDFLLSASEDGTAILWDIKTRKARSKFKHNVESEVLRAAFLDTSSTLITTCGADGRAIVWKTYYDDCETEDNSKLDDETGKSLSAEEHKEAVGSQTNKKESVTGTTIKSNQQTGKRRIRKEAILPHLQTAQIYACECLDINDSSSCLLMTAADSSVYLWDVNTCISEASSSSSSHINSPSHVWTVDSNSCSNSPENIPGTSDGVVSYGGPRNPDNQIFIFDAKVNPQDHNVIALALSDGNIRQIDIRNPVFASISKTTTSLSPTHSSNNKGYRDNASVSTLSSISLSGLSTSPAKRTRVGNTHATSVCFSADGLSLLAALGSGDVAVLDLRMGLVRTLLHSHTRTCFGAAFNTSSLPLKNMIPIPKKSNSSSSSGGGGGVGGVTETHDDNDDENLNTTHKRNLNFSDDKYENYDSDLAPGSRQCITWSSDNSVRSWDISVDGLCTGPVDTVIIPDFPVFCCALKGGDSREFVCGGGNGDPSFIGTPLHYFNERIG